jgi:hypothetical protein
MHLNVRYHKTTKIVHAISATYIRGYMFLMIYMKVYPEEPLITTIPDLYRPTRL